MSILTLNIKEHGASGSEFKFSDYYFRYLNLGKSQIFEPQFLRLVNGDCNNQPHNGTVRLNSSCIYLCEWWLKKANLLTSFLADTEVIALWVCFHLLIHSNFYFWQLLQKKLDTLDQNRYSYSIIIVLSKSYCIWTNKGGRKEIWMVLS